MCAQKEKIKKSLEDNIFYSEQKVIQKYLIYKELFKDDIVREIDDVILFHEQLISKRNSRLSNQLSKIDEKILMNEQVCEALNKRIDEIYHALSGSIDLTELTALSSEINNLKLQLEKLDSYENVLKTQDNKKLLLDSKFSSQNIESQLYLDSIEETIDNVCNTFNGYTFEMYGDEIDSYIRVKNNLGLNFLRYNIEIKISNDSSDGIKNSKIWAYDVTMKKMCPSVFEFLAHDNKIFYGWDYGIAVKALRKLYKENINYQYIFTINQSEYDGFKKEFSDDNLFNQIIESNIKVRLTNNDRLLGMDIDLSEQSK